MKKIYILGGGTVNHVRNHMAVCAPAYGSTARKLVPLFNAELQKAGLDREYEVKLILTKMADHTSPFETNRDVADLLDQIVDAPDTRAVIFNVAMADFEGSISGRPSGRLAERLESRAGTQIMDLIPAPKVIGRIRETRKDIFAVGFKATSHAEDGEQYMKALKLLKRNSLNLVMANDAQGRNMIVAPEETRYCVTSDRKEALGSLVRMTVSRMQNHFTRSTVVPGEAVAWNSDLVPQNLRDVVNHCIEQGAYKPVLGKTAGHFAVKVGEGEFLTSIRKTNYNHLDDIGLVRIESSGPDSVIAHGFRPSVGGQSQRQVFSEHEGLDCIVHFHCPPIQGVLVPSAEQWPNECGSHECGANTSRNLKFVDLGEGHFLKVVYLDNHGPNLVFNRRTPAWKVNRYINETFDLKAKTGGLIIEHQAPQMQVAM